MTKNPFRIAFTRDYLNEAGELAFGDIGLDDLKKKPDVEYLFHDTYKETVSPEQIANIDGMSLIYPRVTADTFALGSDRLTIIARCGAGYEKINLQACTEADVVVVNAPDAVRFPTASASVMFYLVLSKQLMFMEDIVRTGQWDRRGEVKGVEPKGKVLGIVGFGSIGQEISRLVAPFNMKILAYDPYLDPTIAEQLGVELTSLEKLLQESDYVSLHCLLTEETQGLIGAEELALMKPTAFLVNMSRGPVVDHDALVDVLVRRDIAGAGLDVFHQEPLPANDPLTQLDNVVLTPHWAAGTLDAFLDSGTSNISDMLMVAEGNLPNHIVNPEVIKRPKFQSKLARFQC